MIKKVSIDGKLEEIDEPWSPRVVGDIDDYQVKIVKMQGDFEWHHHDEEDEMFLVLSGELIMRTEENDIELEENEFIIIPAGLDHKPVAEREAHVMLFEKESIKRKGD